LNRELYTREDIPYLETQVEEWIGKIEEENKELFKELKERGVVPKNQGYRIKRPIISGILTLSHEAQEKLENLDALEREKFYKEALDFFQNLADALGTDLLYAVVHLDETAPHIHFALRNFRYKEPNMEAVSKLGWEDLWETLKKGLGKAISNTFYSEDSVRVKRKADFMISYSRLQDTLDFFEPLGFGRGIPKKVREARGEPYWKTINRSVRQLHEDLPKEIKLKEKELEELGKDLFRLREKKTELERYVRRLEIEKEQLEQYLEEMRAEADKLRREVEDLSKKVADMRRLSRLEEFLGEVADHIRSFNEEVEEWVREWGISDNLKEELKINEKEALKRLKAILTEAEEKQKVVRNVRRIKADLDNRGKPSGPSFGM